MLMEIPSFNVNELFCELVCMIICSWMEVKLSMSKDEGLQIRTAYRKPQFLWQYFALFWIRLQDCGQGNFMETKYSILIPSCIPKSTETRAPV